MRCMKPTARWKIGKEGESHMECSYCILYCTDWGKQNSMGIAKLVGAVQAEMGRVISDENGFVLEEEADRILTAIRLTSSSKMVLNRLRK